MLQNALDKYFIIEYYVNINLEEETMNFKGTIIIKQEEEWFVAVCLENNIASQGKTIDESIANLKEAISLYYEDKINDELSQNDQFYITTLEMAI
jgi:predicted RNase H-like HicB family nuclease